jgi:diketogulonate reductase-like aldo/keto reductase
MLHCSIYNLAFIALTTLFHVKQLDAYRVISTHLRKIARDVSLHGTSNSFGNTNEIVRTVNSMRQLRLGNSDIAVSELGLGTQRWCSEDFNAPNEELCHQFLDHAILENGVNLIDTAEQYPIPSSPARCPEGLVESVIGRWLEKGGRERREKVIIATKITGGRNVNKKNIVADCEGSLKRLKTDYIDVYLLHWPARYSPQVI